MNRNEKFFNNKFYDDQHKNINRFHNLRNHTNHSESFIDSLKKHSNEVVIFGAGTFYEKALKPLLEVSGIKIKAICNTHKNGQIINDFPIITLEDLLEKGNDLPIIVSAYVEETQIKMQEILLAYDVSQNLIFNPPLSHFPVEELQYFMPDIMKPLPNEVFIDAGCLDGATILKFVEFAKQSGYKQIYGFEPDRAFYEETKLNLKCHGLKDVCLSQARGYYIHYIIYFIN